MTTKTHKCFHHQKYLHYFLNTPLNHSTNHITLAKHPLSLPTTQIHLIYITQMMLHQIHQHPNLIHTQVTHPKATFIIPSTHEESLSSIPSSCFNVHPNETTLLGQQDNLTITLTNKPPHPSYLFLPNDHFENHTQSHDKTILLIKHMNPMLHVQNSIPNHNPTPPSSPSFEHEKFVEELKEAHELSALLGLHLAQRNLDPPPSSSPSSPTIALNEHST